MIEFLKAWYDRNFSNPQAVILVLMILLGTIIVLYWGDILAPVLASMVIAYALEGIVRRLNNFGSPRILAVIFTVFVFVASLLIILLGLVPLVTRQIFEIIRRINKEEKTTIFLVEQNANLALKTADQGYVLENGRIIMHDRAETLLGNQDIQRAYLGI